MPFAACRAILDCAQSGVRQRLCHPRQALRVQHFLCPSTISFGDLLVVGAKRWRGSLLRPLGVIHGCLLAFLGHFHRIAFVIFHEFLSLVKTARSACAPSSVGPQPGALAGGPNLSGLGTRPIRYVRTKMVASA
jgi:hypothetical protein